MSVKSPSKRVGRNRPSCPTSSDRGEAAGHTLPHPEISVGTATVDKAIVITLRNTGDSTQAVVSGKMVADSPDRDIVLAEGFVPARHVEAPFDLDPGPIAFVRNGEYRMTLGHPMWPDLTGITIRFVVTAEYPGGNHTTRYLYEGVYQRSAKHLNARVSRGEQVKP